MTGDQADMLARLKAVLPTRWFADTTPILDGLLSGLAITASWAYQFLATVRLQTRLNTAVDAFLDIAAQDFFGTRIRRAPGQADAAFRITILREMFRPRATRPAFIAGITDLTGRPPTVFEPSRPGDTGAWNGRLGYGVAGHWGSLSLPNQVFITAYRPTAPNADGETVADADIYAAARGLVPAACTAWTRITN